MYNNLSVFDSLALATECALFALERHKREYVESYTAHNGDDWHVRLYANLGIVVATCDDAELITELERKIIWGAYPPTYPNLRLGWLNKNMTLPGSERFCHVRIVIVHKSNTVGRMYIWKYGATYDLAQPTDPEDDIA